MEAIPEQKMTALQETIARLQKENEELMQSRRHSRSRPTSEGRDQIAKTQKESETPKLEKSRLAKAKTEESVPSRTSTPVPKEEKLERSRSRRVSGIFNAGASSKGSRAEEGHRGHHRDRTS